MKTIKLSEATTKGERTIDSLTFADPKVRHLLVLDNYPENSRAGDVAFAASLTGESELLIGELCPKDWVAVREHLATVYADFMGLSHEKALAAIGANAESPTQAAEQKKN